MASTIGVPRGETPSSKTIIAPAAKKPVSGLQAAINADTASAPKKASTSSVDPYGGLTGANRDAAVAIGNLFTSYGIPTLASTIVKYVQQGYSSDTISILLADTPEYKQRFAANDARLKAGLPVLSPAQYISTEDSYRQIMNAAGLPPGFYDQTSDFTNFIAGDVSPTEVQSRVNEASEALNNAPASTLSYMKQFYNVGDLVAYALDPKVAQPLIDQRLKAAESAALASQNGINLSQANAEDIGRTGQSLANIQSGISFIGSEEPTTDKLGAIYGGAVTQDDLVQEVFDNNSAAAKKRQTLASQQRASFGATAGVAGNSSLGKDTGGAF